MPEKSPPPSLATLGQTLRVKKYWATLRTIRTSLAACQGASLGAFFLDE